jgi:hypothetical protein
VRLTVVREVADYFVTEVPGDFGRSFRVEKVGIDGTEPPYEVNIDGDKRMCCCRGFSRFGYCRHADGLAALIQAGKL